MYIKLKNGNIEKYPYSIYELKQDNKNVSFPANISDEILARFEVYPVIQVPAPQIDYTQILTEETPNLVEGKWYQDWSITSKSVDVINTIHEDLRAVAYRNESDPLFFKVQRGELEMQVWLDKVAEIKARYPKVS